MLIDCPPNLHLCSWTALAASDHLVVPLQPEDYGAQGIADVLESLARVRAAGFPVGLLGYLITMVSPRRTLHQLYEEQLRELYGRQVFTARVPESPEFPEAISRRQTIAQYKPKGAAAKAIRSPCGGAARTDHGGRVAGPGGGGMSKRDELMKGLPMCRESMGDFGGAVRGAPGAGPRPMPAHLVGVVRSKDVSQIAIDRIDRDPRQPREEFDPEGLERLAQSLRQRGLLQPIRVRWDAGQERYVIICGERRWRAAKMAGLESLACVIVEGDLTHQERLAIQLVENALREDLKPIEQARAYKTLMKAQGGRSASSRLNCRSITARSSARCRSWICQRRSGSRSSRGHSLRQPRMRSARSAMSISRRSSRAWSSMA